ncbi:MAG: HAD family hydrolase [Thermoplasmata archaeon]|nr:HAD family hydrolase [Candidatus Sysuiplasma jiujiangense]
MMKPGNHNGQLRSHSNSSLPGAVFFDLDETIFEFRSSSRAGLKAVISSFPQLSSVGDETLESLYWNLGKETLQLVRSGNLEIGCESEYRFKKLLEFLGLNVKEDELSSLIVSYDAEFSKQCRTVPGAREILAGIRDGGIKIGVITNGPRKTQIKTLERLKLNPLIDFMITPDDAGALKPDPRIFIRATDLAEVPPENSVMVGDSWANDILGASSLGIKPVWFNRKGEQIPLTDVAISITTLWELPGIIGLQPVISPP